MKICHYLWKISSNAVRNFFLKLEYLLEFYPLFISEDVTNLICWSFSTFIICVKQFQVMSRYSIVCYKYVLWAVKIFFTPYEFWIPTSQILDPPLLVQAANGLETQLKPPHPISNIASPMEPPQFTLLDTWTEPSKTGHAWGISLIIQTKPYSFEWFLPIISIWFRWGC